MKTVNLVLRRIVQLLLSVLATTKLMEKMFNDLPDLNFFVSSSFFSMCIFVLLISYENSKQNIKTT